MRLAVTARDEDGNKVLWLCVSFLKGKRAELFVLLSRNNTLCSVNFRRTKRDYVYVLCASTLVDDVCDV